MNPIFKIDYEFDSKSLLEELMSQPDASYEDTTHGDVPNFRLINSVLDIATAEMERFCSHFKLPIGKPRYYKVDEDSVLLPHIDHNTKCSINHILNDDAAPIMFAGYGEFQYKTALLDTSQIHGVDNLKKPNRYLYKISFLNHDFREIVKCLQS